MSRRQDSSRKDGRARPTGGGRARRFHPYQDLTKVVMARSRLRLAEERLIPFEAPGTSLTPMIVQVRFIAFTLSA